MHIMSPNGVPKWGTRTLCGIKGFNFSNLRPILEAIRENSYYADRPELHIPIPQSTCNVCCIRQDSMFNRGWKQTEFQIQYNVKIGALYWVKTEWKNNYLPYRKGFKTVIATLWDVKEIKNALELHKLGHKEF